MYPYKVPFITLKWSQTIDGQLADDINESKWISGVEERRYTHLLRSQHDVVLVGAQTFLKDLCQLTVRDIMFDGHQPCRIILDPKGRLIEAIKQDESVYENLTTGPRNTYILTDVFEDGYPLMSQKNKQLIVVQYRFDNFNQWLPAVLNKLSQFFQLNEKRPLNKIMVEGGAITLSEFMKLNLVNQIEVSISPLILGGQANRLATKNLLKNVSRFELINKMQLGEDILLKYKVNKLNYVTEAFS